MFKPSTKLPWQRTNENIEKQEWNGVLKCIHICSRCIPLYLSFMALMFIYCTHKSTLQNSSCTTDIPLHWQNQITINKTPSQEHEQCWEQGARQRSPRRASRRLKNIIKIDLGEIWHEDIWPRSINIQNWWSSVFLKADGMITVHELNEKHFDALHIPQPCLNSVKSQTWDSSSRSW
jgi:hypothetical protein